jgi:hypothetical protein
MQLFDFHARWHEVQAVLERPRVADTLDTVMACICTDQNVVWEPAKGPWHFGDRRFHPAPPSPDTPAWYRAYMYCREINSWCGVIGEELEPRLHWRVLLAADGYHATACGFEDEACARPELICDLVYDWDEDEPRSGAEIFEKVANRGAMKAWRVNEAIEALSASTRNTAEVLRMMRSPAERDRLLHRAIWDAPLRSFLNKHGWKWSDDGIQAFRLE